ncbi:MAG: M18 family aminopeptidase [Deltaproteobacteria bacterium]|nr:M18 family aminopeptidase [Deltaproteobacteria bacterium]
MKEQQLTDGFIRFIKSSPTAFHAVQTVVNYLKENHFSQRDLKDDFQIGKSEKCFIINGDSSLIAVRNPANDLGKGLHLVGAHTDSPSLKIRPNPDLRFKDILSISVEIYGSPLIHTWFDRDLSIAGKVNFCDSKMNQGKVLVDFSKPVASIPSLAIHLENKSGDPRKIDPQKELIPIFSELSKNDQADFNQILLYQIKIDYPDLDIKEVLDYDLFLYDSQPPCEMGVQNKWINSGRIDNLLSCYAAMTAFVEADSDKTSLMVLYDHEEIGSTSNIGAGGPFLKSVLSRLTNKDVLPDQIIANSRFLSADNSHAIHPNYPEKHDSNHAPLMNKGPVIKINANQRYANDSDFSSWLKLLLKKTNIPYQVFCNRNDLRCGSTIGPMTAANIGIKTLDVGAPMLAMHSIREICGKKDIHDYYRLIKEFYKSD